MRSLHLAVPAVLVFGVVACSGDVSSRQGGADDASAAGTGTGNGGASATGGRSPGGASSSGGRTGAGGSGSSTGGAAGGSAGVPGSGGATGGGGTPATGGISGNGGTPGAGGASVSGGAPGADAGPDASSDASSGSDGSSDASSSTDGGGDAEGGPTCSFGEVASAGTNQDLNLFGTIVYFDDGALLPAGRYRVTYVDGCMKYSSNQDWTIHAYADGRNGWWFVGDTTATRIQMPPGTVGYATSNGAYATFDACVAANLLLPPVEFDFVGGRIGVWLQDSPYSDNLAGQDNRNPKWKLTLLGECVSTDR